MLSSKAFIIVMERPPNSMDLFDLVSVFGRLEEVVARHLFNQVLRTVQDLYAICSVVHQDLKVGLTFNFLPPAFATHAFCVKSLNEGKTTRFV